MKVRVRWDIHRQILAIAVLPALMVTLILIFVVYQGHVRQNQAAFHRQGELLAAQLAATLEYALSTGAIEQIPSTVEATVTPAMAALNTQAVWVKIFDKQDQPLHTAASIGPAVQSAYFTRIEDHHQVFAAPIYLDPIALLSDTPPARRYLGKVELAISTRPIRTLFTQRLLGDLALVMATFAAAVVLAHRIGRRLSLDIRNAARAIERIKGGDLNVRLAKTAIHEIGTLQEGVNLLAEAIASAQARLEKELAKVRGEYQQTLDELRDQTRKAEQANQAKSQFLAKVSHEMRTPLYSIQGLAEQLLKTRRDAGEVRTLRTLMTAIGNLYQTISDILDFTQLEKDKFVPSPAPLHLWDEIESVVDTVGPLVSRQNLYVDVIVSCSVPPTVIGDGKAFRTIVANLMSNAIKFTETGGIVIRLDVEDVAADSTAPIRLQISDTGRGIPSDKLASIFAPFEQAESALNRRYAGTGLGLSIVQGYCEALGGRIEVASRPGQGATFTVYLPFRKHPTDPGSIDQPAFAALAGLNMLVVDERSSFCASVACRLASLNVNSAHRVMSVQDLSTIPPPASPYDVLIVRDLTLRDPETLLPLHHTLSQCAKQVVSLTTGDELPPAQEYRRYGIDAVLWSGASRATLYEELKTVVHGEQPILEPEPDNLALRSLLAGKLILVVEDFAINRNIMADQLHHHGLRVIEAESGEEAVAKAHTCPPDLILMDIQMPGMDGIQAIQAIRSLPACAELPIIGFTASADKPTHQRVMAAGANRVLTKPLCETDLIGAIYQVLVPSAAKT